MNISKRAKLIVAAAGIAAAAATTGAAFTGAGVALGSGVSSDQFVGGTLTGNVTGATLSGIDFGYISQGSGEITSAKLTFDSPLASGETVKLAFTGGSPTTDFTCNVNQTTTTEWDCSGDYTGASGYSITVSDFNGS